jgi:hypothetical protein
LTNELEKEGRSIYYFFFFAAGFFLAAVFFAAFFLAAIIYTSFAFLRPNWSHHCDPPGFAAEPQ